MNNMTFNPYLFFTGNAREAMEFYKGIFGGELSTQTYDDVPGPTPDGMEGKLMHSALTGGTIDLMGSDTAKASAKAAKVSLSFSGDNEEKMTKIFNGLSVGAQETYGLKKEFWGDTFGQITDKYGIDWMVSIRPKS